jgi:hypothetical protein
MAHILSKSTFMYGRQCEKRLYLNKYKRNQCDPYDHTTLALFAQGTNVGVLAQSLFEGGANAQGEEPYASSKTAEKTAKLLPIHNVIYEAAFVHEGVLCAVDILVRKGKKYYAFEVKSTNSVKPQHVQDAALQYYVLKHSGLSIADFSVIHFNRDYVRDGDIDVKQLFSITSILDEVQQYENEIAQDIARFKNILADKDNEPQVLQGAHCHTPYDCNFQSYCAALNPIAPEKPQPNPDMHITYYKQAVSAFIKQLQYPLYFLDFETVMYGVPAFNQSSPYQQIPFQFSIHVQQSPQADLLHIAYLGDGVNDPREALLKTMIHALGVEGSIVVWNVTFERSCLQKLAVNFPKYKLNIESIINRMVDLMAPFRRKEIHSEAFYDSYSIKSILPVMVPHLRYDVLKIQDGGNASQTYANIHSLSILEQQEARQNLLEYCRLDTLAMAEILAQLYQNTTDQKRAKKA